MPKYNPNSPYWLEQARARAERRLEGAQRRLEELHTLQKIAALNKKLQLLNELVNRCHSPQEPTAK